MIICVSRGGSIKILFIYPPYYKTDTIAPPLGLAYIAAVLKKHGYSPVIKDLNIEPGYDDLDNSLKDYDVVGISFLTSMYNEALTIAKTAHKHGCIVIMGGPHASALPHELLQNEDIDIVVRKEGEYTTLELIQALEKNKELSGIKGLSFKQDDRIIDNPDREYIQNLDEIPFPARELLLNERYEIRYPGFDEKKPITAMMTSRGCPSRCIFCASNVVFGRKARYRSPKNIVDEIEEIVNRYGIHQINFSDDTFTLRSRFVIETCDEIIKRNLDIRWACSTRVPKLKKEMLTKMKQAGCTRVGFGIESGSPLILKNIKKGITVEQAERALAITDDVGLKPIAYFIVGNPGEDYETIWETIDFIHRNRKYLPETRLGKFVVPYPGTELLDIAREKNHLLTEDWSKYYHHFKPLIRTETLDYSDLSRAMILGNLHISLKKSISPLNVIKTMALFVYNLDLRGKGFKDLGGAVPFLKASLRYLSGYLKWSELNRTKNRC